MPSTRLRKWKPTAAARGPCCPFRKRAGHRPHHRRKCFEPLRMFQTNVNHQDTRLLGLLGRWSCHTIACHGVPIVPCDGSVSTAGRSLKPEDQREMGAALQVLGSVPKLSPHDRLKRRRLRAGHPFVLSKRHLQISVERRWKPLVNGIVERKKTPLLAKCFWSALSHLPIQGGALSDSGWQQGELLDCTSFSTRLWAALVDESLA